MIKRSICHENLEQGAPGGDMPRLSIERGGKMPISQFLHGGGLTMYFPSGCLRTQLLIILQLGTSDDHLLWDSSGF